MRYHIVLNPRAQVDVIESVNWYNNEKENLGLDFYNALNERLQNIALAPFQSPKRYKDVFTSRLNRFPYLIYFRINKLNSTVIVLAVLHMSRNPGIIKERK